MKALIFLIISILLFSCKQEVSVDATLKQAGDNRAELEKVLEHYKNNNDKEKIEAAKFLIANMMYKYSYEGDILTHYDTIFELYQNIRKDSIYIGDPSSIRKVWDEVVNQHGKIDISRLQRNFDSQQLKGQFLIDNIDQAFDVWRKSPYYNYDNVELFYEYILPYRISHEPVESYRDRYYSMLKHIADTATAPLYLIKGFHDKLNKQEHFRSSSLMWDYPIELPLSKLEIGRRGACRHLTTFGALAMRACGLPVTIDRAIWANRSQGHSWNVLLLNDSIFPFDALSYSRLKMAYKPAKIFRKRFSVNFDLIEEVSINDIPASFFIIDEIDVTHEYINTCDIIVPMIHTTEQYKKKKYGIICVFDNNNWRPVYWGRIKSNNMIFKNMAVDIAYIAAYYDNGKVIPASEPFLVHADGRIEFCSVDKDKLMTLHLERKYPRFKRIEDHAWGLRRSNAEGANNPTFDNSIIFFSIYDIPLNVADKVVSNPNKYRYIRFSSALHRQANFAEVELYGKKSEGDLEIKLSGTIIGFPPIKEDNEHPYTHAMDGDLETYFAKPKQSSGWVGLDLGKGNEHIITRVRFAPRSDTNFILEGDTYELMYWNDNKWNSMGRKKAEQYNIITYDNVPAGTLYILHNHSRGKEERIFTYNEGKQIWW